MIGENPALVIYIVIATATVIGLWWAIINRIIDEKSKLIESSPKINNIINIRLMKDLQTTSKSFYELVDSYQKIQAQITVAVDKIRLAHQAEDVFKLIKKKAEEIKKILSDIDTIKNSFPRIQEALKDIRINVTYLILEIATILIVLIMMGIEPFTSLPSSLITVFAVILVSIYIYTGIEVSISSYRKTMATLRKHELP